MQLVVFSKRLQLNRPFL